MLQDSLRSKVDQHCEALNKHFHELDPSSSGFVSKEKFKVCYLLCSIVSYLTGRGDERWRVQKWLKR